MFRKPKDCYHYSGFKFGFDGERGCEEGVTCWCEVNYNRTRAKRKRILSWFILAICACLGAYIVAT